MLKEPVNVARMFLWLMQRTPTNEEGSYQSKNGQFEQLEEYRVGKFESKITKGMLKTSSVRWKQSFIPKQNTSRLFCHTIQQKRHRE